MAHPAPALRKFVSQVLARFPDAEVDYGDPDGLDRIRSATFDRATSKAIRELATAAAVDSRVASVAVKGGKGKERITVTVVSDVRADYVQPFWTDRDLDVIFSSDDS